MKIEDRSTLTGPQPSALASISRRPSEAAAPETPPAGGPAAKVELSGRGREMHRALAAADAAPDVRTAKVEDARQRLAQGTYTVNAEVVARGVLDTTA